MGIRHKRNATYNETIELSNNERPVIILLLLQISTSSALAGEDQLCNNSDNRPKLPGSFGRFACPSGSTEPLIISKLTGPQLIELFSTSTTAKSAPSSLVLQLKIDDNRDARLNLPERSNDNKSLKLTLIEAEKRWGKTKIGMNSSHFFQMCTKDGKTANLQVAVDKNNNLCSFKIEIEGIGTTWGEFL